MRRREFARLAWLTDVQRDERAAPVVGEVERLARVANVSVRTSTPAPSSMTASGSTLPVVEAAEERSANRQHAHDSVIERSRMVVVFDPR